MPFLISAPFSPDSYERLIKDLGGSAPVAFSKIGLEVTQRFFNQQEIPPPLDPFLEAFWKGIWEITHREGLPKPLSMSEIGEAKELDDAYVGKLSEEVLSRLPQHRTSETLLALAFQIFTALLSPEFKACRQSYLEEDASGSCARQDLQYCSDRVSGSHCEDCPYFVAMSAQQHRKLLSKQWCGDVAVFENHSDLFLPEDFRALRIFWHLYLRHNTQ